MPVEWSPAALADIGRIYDYIATFNPAAAARLAERLLDAADELGKFPNRGRPGSPGFRELTVVSPYIVIYQVDDRCVTILRVWHGAQNR